MDNLKKKVGYLRGLAEGLALEETSKEGKLFGSVFDILDEMVGVIEKIVVSQLEVEEYLDIVEEDLANLNEVIFESDEDEEYDDEDDEEYEREEDNKSEEPTVKREKITGEIELACPHCLKVLDLEPSILEDEDVIEIICPNCEKAITITEEREETKTENNTENDEPVREISH